MKFSKTKLALAVAGMALLGAQAAWAAPDAAVNDLVTITQGPGGNSGGGSFLIDNQTSAASDFLSFCLERTEFFTPGGTYMVGGITTSAVNQGGLGPDPLDYKTAWLYSAFRAGGAGLTGYGSNSAADNANALQNAIWYIEGETTLASGLATDFYNDAVAAAPTSLGLVRVMNVVSTNGQVNHQDQLMMIPEPETYAMLLAGLGLMGFVARRRQRKLAAA